MSTVVSFEDVSKKFILRKERARSFQELALYLSRRKGSLSEEFWALRDVNFKIEQGETVGLIGVNGAGKSTALKLISRVIVPTSGSISVNGRVGALLELGAGFHPDLTGRENIYLNGSILGLSKDEIRKHMDEIIAFAELERFIDVSVKHYSSGMYVRLGFSVAVHTRPEILLVDEVLAVGDATFQRKCLDRINQLRQDGVTILFVSHSADTVRTLCSRALWLEDGRLVADDAADVVVSRYLADAWEKEEGNLTCLSKDGRCWGNGAVKITQVRLLNSDGQERQNFHVGDTLVVEINYDARCRIEHPVFGLAIHRGDDLHITGPNTKFSGYEIPSIEGKGRITFTLPFIPLLEGAYYISVAVHDWEDSAMFDYHDRLYPFRVLDSRGERYGIMALQGDWSWEM